MPDAPTPTVLLAFALPAASWEAAQANVTGAEAPAPAWPREGPIVTEFSAVDVTAGAETIRLEGPGATLEVGPANMFRVGRRVSLPFVAAAPGGAADALEVSPAMSCVFLGLMRHLGWPATAGTDLLRALYASEESIPEAALTAMAAAPAPAPAPPAADSEHAQPEAPAEEHAEEHAHQSDLTHPETPEAP